MDNSPTTVKGKPIDVHPEKWWKNLKKIREDYLGYMSTIHTQYDTCFELNLGFKKLLLSKNPEVIRHYMEGDYMKFPKASGYKWMGLFLGNGLVVNEGKSWKKQRRLAQPSFHRNQLAKLSETMVNEIETFRVVMEEKEGQSVDVFAEMMAITLNIVGRSMFNTGFSQAELKDVHAWVPFMMDFITEIRSNPIARTLSKINGRRRKFNTGLAKLDQMIYRIIEERHQESEPRPDLTGMFMSAVDEDTGQKMDDKAIRDELMTLFMAGHETSANALTWAIYLLSRHPEELQKVLHEVETVLQGRLPGFEELPRMTYTRQVLLETMRLYPPVPLIARRNTEAFDLMGYHFPAESDIVFDFYHLHRDPDLWDEPNRFDPSRFTPEKEKSRPYNHYLPFASGPRRCIGDRFAMMEMQMVLAVLLRNFNFKPLDSAEKEIETHITLRPKGGLFMELEKRN